jgi:translation initiation factor IF-2
MKVSDLAKELGVESKSIIAKLRAEGIGEDIVKTHASTVKAGLVATIREWHAAGEIPAAEKAAADGKSKSKAKARKADGSDGGDTAVAVAAPPEEHAKTAPVEVVSEVKTAKPPAAPERPVEKVIIKPAAEKSVVLSDPSETHAKATPVKPSMPSAPVVVAHATTAPPMKPEVMGKSGATAAPSMPAASGQSAPAAGTSHPSAAGNAAVSGPTGASGGNHPGGGRPPAPGTGGMVAPNRPGPVGQQNVPKRPTAVIPAGPKLENRAPVKLSGPKVVRIEAPEPVEAPRPRRVGPSTGGPGGGGSRPMSPGRSAGGYGGGSDDDRGRSPRRNTGGGSGGPAGKRSTGAGVPERRRASADDWVGGGNVFSEQDLIEREARLIRSGGFLKKRRQDAKRPGTPGGQTHLDTGEQIVEIAAPFTIKDLSAATGVKGADIVKKLFLQGVIVTINSGLDAAKAQEIMIDFEIDLRVVEKKTAEEAVSVEFGEREAKDLQPRGPVVTILGHVDHGKTSLLDKIRNANVAAGEAGGITQKTSAFRVSLNVNGEDKEVVFFDTPGHEAFTSMRARGATVTDVVVLVVSAPEGVMPQTIESINHAKAAKVPLVVALNKIDRPDATEAAIQKTLGQLAAAGINPQEWGGDTEVIRVSATTGKGIPELLETLDLQATILELKADFAGHARGTVIEARMEEGRGPVANVLVQQGHLRVGDYVVMGRAFGRVRDITDDRGQKFKDVTPPWPVQVSGLNAIPDAGDKFFVVDSLRKAQEAAENRQRREREAALAAPKVTLDNIFTQIADKDLKEILVVLKADLQGTVDVLKAQCEKVSTDEIKVRVLHSAIGGITENDVNLAEASRAIIIGFNVIPSGKARSVAESKGIEIRTYQVIYDIVDDLKKAAEGMLKPDLREEVLGHAEVRQVFKVSRVGSVAGCYVTDGLVQRDALIRVTRDGVVIEHDRVLEQLKRVKDDAKEVRSGMECGMKIVGYDDIKQGDVLECYRKVEVKRSL